ncbi:MAG: oligosaccharide flippase family protein, partial [Actinobacteria bacterium]|nr:oligosaccharide flippase family protein [Actinomycetota bacterium]
MAARPVEDEVERGDALAAVVRGMAVAMVGSIFGSSLGFVLLVLMGRRLAPDELGLFVLALNLVNLVPQITIAGVDYAAIRYVSEARTPGAKRGAMLTPFAVAMAFNLAIGGSAFALARPLALHVFGQPHFVEGLRATALTLPLTVAAQMISAAISGLERASGELVRKVVEQGGRIAFAFAAVLAGAGVGGIVLGLAAAAAVATLACAVTLAVVLPRGGRTQPVAVRAVVGFAWPQTVATAVGRSWSLLMLAFVSNLVGAHGVAIFGIAAALSRLPGLVYNSFTYRFTPTISRL